MQVVALICGVFLGTLSLIMTQDYTHYAAYSLPRDCEVNERRPNLLDPYSFYWCLVDGPVLMKCVTGTFFNVTAGRCTEEVKNVLEENSLSKNDTKVEDNRCPQPKMAPRGIKCPTNDPLDRSVYHADPDSCECFYQCDNRVAKRIPCWEGLHFNTTTNLCDWPEEAGCASYTKDNQILDV